ncbi:MAG: uncharacterized protein KVP18_001163 [Porospora cf. gigantea A]|uniref:uncharacterized protein n=1 Tax=Porospora cf. gigantea A TaxID=2853593 RepID=UPI0035595A20|nr:MAG: hypothetical protein KVP18_001163 [Porospora cf. gigantea A]
MVNPSRPVTALYTEALELANVTLKAKGVKSAVQIMKEFFDTNQEPMAAHFTSKSVKQVEQEMQGHMLEASTMFASIMKSNPEKAQAFFSELQDMVDEEFQAFKEYAS